MMNHTGACVNQTDCRFRLLDTEQLLSIGSGLRLKIFEGLAPEFGQELGGVGDEGWLVALAPVWDGGQEGAIGFEDEPVERDSFGGFELPGVFGEGHDAI